MNFIIGPTTRAECDYRILQKFAKVTLIVARKRSDNNNSKLLQQL